MSDTFKEYLHECFQGEVLGEALGRALAESAQDADHRQKWRFLEQLERETKERIRAALEALGEKAEEDPIQKSVFADKFAKYDTRLKQYDRELRNLLRPALV